MARRFPLLHDRLELTRVDTHGLLFRWAGASADEAGGADGAPRRRAGRGDVAAPGLRRRHRRRHHLGPRHARRQGLRRRHLRRGRDAARRADSCRRRTSGCPSAATRRSPARPPSWPSRSCDAAGSSRGSCSTRAAPIASEAFPGVAAPIGVIGADREGRDVARAAGRGPRRARVDPGEDGPDGPHRPRHHPIDRSSMTARIPAPTDRAVPPHGTARPAAAAPAADERRPAQAGADQGAAGRRARRPRR